MHELSTDAVTAARRLLGARLIRELDGRQVIVRIVETEAYDQTDIASHSYRGQTPRNSVMFGRAGHLYVYFTYGMHYCCNIVTGEIGEGSAVLIRAVEPIEGIELLRERRHDKPDLDLCNGPAKLCQALDIDRQLNGHDLRQPPIQLLLQAPLQDEKITVTTRIGIRHGTSLSWRFYITDSQYVSHI